MGAALSTLVCYIFRTAMRYYFRTSSTKFIINGSHRSHVLGGAVYYFLIGGLHIGMR